MSALAVCGTLYTSSARAQAQRSHPIKKKRKSVVGDYGYGDRNTRGTWLVQWAMAEKLCITNTLFQHSEQQTWTYVNGNRRRQIDFICIDKSMWRSVCDSKSMADIGVGRDHQAVKLELSMTSAKSRKHRPKSRRRWTPADKSKYANAIDVSIALFKAEDTWRTHALEENVAAIEDVLLETAELCREDNMTAATTSPTPNP